MSPVAEIKDRIKHLIASKTLTPAKFADIIGVQRSGISHILSGRNKPSLDVLNKILVSFPDVSGDWLITGNGDMLKTKRDVSEKELFPPVNNESEQVAEPENMNREEDSPPYGAGNNGRNKEIKSAATTKQSSLVPSGEKEIERIVVFYSDGTFKEYTPG